MASWPSGLPQIPLMAGYEETFPDTAIRTEMEVGPAKVRRRTSHNVRPLSVGFYLTTAQVDILDTFYSTTLSGGTLAFDHEHPRTGDAAELRFTGPPKISVAGADYLAEFGLEIMP
jgi:hypothetical protein